MEFKIIFGEGIDLIKQAVYIVLNCSGPSDEQWKPYKKRIIRALLM